MPLLVQAQVTIHSFTSNKSTINITESVLFTVEWSSTSANPVNNIIVVYKDGKADTVKATPIIGTHYQALFNHNFNTAGVYDVDIKNGAVIAFTIRITVIGPANQAPSITLFNVPSSAVANAPINIPTKAVDPDGKDLNFTLTVGLVSTLGFVYGPYLISGSVNGTELVKQFDFTLTAGSYFLTLLVKQTKYLTVGPSNLQPEIKFVRYNATIFTGEHLAIVDSVRDDNANCSLYTEYTQGTSHIVDVQTVITSANVITYVIVSPLRYFNNVGIVSVRQWIIDPFGLASQVTTFTAEVKPRITDVEDNSIPIEFKLNQNYPNPFNPTTKISYALPEAANVRLVVYNLLGAEVAELVNSEQSVGIHEVQFNAGMLSSGIYIYKISAGKYTATKKLILMK